MNSKFYVSFELAKLLFAKGYDCPCDSNYYMGRLTYPRPTIAEVIDWLWCKWGISISVLYEEPVWHYTIHARYDSLTIKGQSVCCLESRIACEIGAIVEALELLPNVMFAPE